MHDWIENKGFEKGSKCKFLKKLFTAVSDYEPHKKNLSLKKTRKNVVLIA